MRIVLLLILIIVSLPSFAVDDPANCPRSCTNPDHKHDWSDESRNYISNRADVLVRWVDDFFGQKQQNTESKTSFMRLRSSVFIREGETEHYRVNLRGKVYLKNLDERLSLLFSDDNDNQTDSQNLNEVSQQLNRGTDVALQFNEIKTEHHRLDYRIGIRSSLQPKAEIRYRYERPYGKNELFRSIQRLRYRGEDRFDIVSEFEQAHAMSDSRLLRTSLQLNYGEITDGVEWRAGIQLSKKLDDHKAINYFANMRGHTQPRYINDTYGVGANYRRSLYKEWLFVEIEPGYFWNKNLNTGTRDGAPQLIARLEVLFD